LATAARRRATAVECRGDLVPGEGFEPPSATHVAALALS